MLKIELTTEPNKYWWWNFLYYLHYYNIPDHLFFDFKNNFLFIYHTDEFEFEIYSDELERLMNDINTFAVQWKI